MAAVLVRGGRLLTRAAAKAVALVRQPLFANAGYLLGVNLVGALVGFVFWGLAARLYPPEEVGTASAVISAVTLVSGIAGLGMGTGVVRFLPETRSPRRFLNTVFTFNGLTAVLVGGAFLAGLSLWSPSLVVLRENSLYITGFLVYAIAMTLDAMVRSVFVARRQALYALIQTCVINGGRLLLVPVLVGLGAAGLVGTVAIATVLAIALSFLGILPRVELGYRPRADFSWSDLAGIIPYSVANYVGGLLTQTSRILLPLIVLEMLGSASSGYTYIAWMLGSLLASPGMSLANSAFAEGSNAPHRSAAILFRAGGLALLLTLPAAMMLGLAAPWVLLLFGPTYAREGAGLLRWLAGAAPFVVLTGLYFTYLRVRKRVGRLMVLSAAVAVITLGVAALLIDRAGIAASGIGWLLGNGLVTGIALASVWKETSADRAEEQDVPADGEHSTLGESPVVVAAIPCYNEERFIGGVVRRVAQYVDRVLVVDDGSTDRTAEVAEGAGATVIRHAANRGPGAAYRTCFQAARESGAGVLITLDGDEQHNPDELPRLLSPLLEGQAELVIGSRFLEPYEIARYRKFGIDVITFLYNLGSKVKVVDAQSCYRGYSKRALENLRITEDGFGFSVELLVQARHRGLSILEVPISCIYHEASHSMNPVLHGVGVALMVVKHRALAALNMLARNPVAGVGGEVGV
jgi:O-antigen/teichoic acid export membrane protein